MLQLALRAFAFRPAEWAAAERSPDGADACSKDFDAYLKYASKSFLAPRIHEAPSRCFFGPYLPFFA